MSVSSLVEASSTLLPPSKPPRISARHHSVSSGTDNATERMLPPIPPKSLSVNPTAEPKLSIGSTSLIKNKAPPSFNSKEASPITRDDKSPTSLVSVHESSERRDSISSLLSNSSLETYLNEIKQLGRQVKRHLLENEDVMSLGNRMPQPPTAVGRNRAISQAKQAVAHPSVFDANDSTPPSPVEEEKKQPETASDEPPPANEDDRHKSIDEQPTIPIAYANEKRNLDFHILFRSVPEEDRLIEEYNCAIYKDILVQGKLYISQEHLCFNAKFFGWVTNLVLAYKDIKSIEKRNMALIVPNGIQITTHLDTKHVFASFMTRDYTFDLIYQAWQAFLFPKKEVIETNDSLSLATKEEADLVNQYVAQEQTIPEETVVDPEQPPQQDMANKYHQWIVMDEVYFGTVEGFYKLLYQSNFVHQYLIEMMECQDVLFGAWDQKLKTRTSIITKDDVKYQVIDTEICHQQDAMFCISSTVTSKSSVNLRYKVCITRKTNAEIEAVISIHHQQYIPLFKSLQKLLSRKSTKNTLQRLSEGKEPSTCWQHSKRLELQQKYVVPSVEIIKQAYLVFVLTVQSAYQYAQALKREHWLIVLLLTANLLILHHMNARVYQLEHQHSPSSHMFPINTVLNETAYPVELQHIEFMQLKMNEIKQKMELLQKDVALQKQQLLNEPQE